MSATATAAASRATLVRAAQALRTGDAAGAIALAAPLIARDTDDAGALTIVALARIARGDRVDALPLLRRLVALAPDVPAHRANLGNVLRDLGQREEAALAYDRALALRPDEPSLLYNRALLHLDLGEVGDARRLLARANRVAPRDAEIATHLVRTLVEAGAEQEARALLRDIDDTRLSSPESLLALASSVTQLGPEARARVLLDRALAAAPDDPAVHAHLALDAERHNRLDDAHAHVARAASAGHDGVDLHAARSRLALRGGDVDRARVAARAAVDAATSEATRAPHLFELAKACDRAGDVDAAFAALTRAHAARAAQWRRDDPASAASEPALLTILRERITAADVAAWPPHARVDDAPSPVFVVGFPRSGTTLLEQMLDAHPALRAMDERPYLQYTISRAFRLGIDYPRGLDRLTDAQAVALRAYYRECVADVARLADGETLVDKNPLNLARLPMIARLWPGARVIVALRDPRDVVLSCFMQNFRNPGIARLCDGLARTADTYAAMFDAFESQAPALPLRWLRLRYEDLVAAPDAQARRVCDFLGIDPHAAMAAPGDHARARGYIATPSYAQVVEPVTTRAVGRWRRYEKYFGDALATLAPWLERYGYDAR